MSETKPRRIGAICNAYGALYVQKIDGEFYWSIEDYNGHYWEEIPESLYAELLRFADSQNAPRDQKDN